MTDELYRLTWKDHVYTCGSDNTDVRRVEIMPVEQYIRDEQAEADVALGAAVKADGWDADMWDYAAESLEKFPEQLEGLILKCRVIAAALDAEQKEENNV